MDENKARKVPSQNGRHEIKLNARAVSRGVAIGKIVCLHGRKRQFYKLNLESGKIDREIRRFRAAVRLASRQLKKISVDKIQNGGEIKSSIFEAHLLILEDKSLHTKIETYIREQRVNAEWAVKETTGEYIAKYKTISDEHLRERYIDLEDVAERLLTALGGGGKSNIRLEKDAIIVAKEVKPSTLIELAERNPLAIITENGGWTSHTFILAREMNLPAVTGVKRILRRVQNGDQAIVDGFGGQIILHPERKTARQYKIASKEFRRSNEENFDSAREILKTLDGREITIRANLDFPKGYAAAKRLGAKGIGLYRSEFLFNQYRGYPGEQEQIEAYRKIAQMVGDDGVRIRTFDLSVEQLADETVEREINPALGLRAVRLSLSHVKQFQTQFRALLQAAPENNISIVLPMIGDVAEIRRSKKILEKERERLKRKKIETGIIHFGAMIEVPSAVIMIEEILSEVDFVCLGTNDLVQYLLAVDRDNETAADWFRTLHPAVLRSIKTVFRAVEKLEKPVIVCGEMAGSPVYAPILIGLGATELSMNVNSIARVRKVVSEIALEEAAGIAKTLGTFSTADEAEDFISTEYLKKWSHLFSSENLPKKFTGK